MARDRETSTPGRPERLPLGRLPKALFKKRDDAARREKDSFDLVGDTAEHAASLTAVPVAGDVGPGPADEPLPGRRPAPQLPVGPFEGQSAQNVLRRYATDAVAVLFDAVNSLNEYAELASHPKYGPKGLAVASMAKKGAGMLADRIVGFTVGQKLDVNITMKSQEDVPKWDQLPVEVRARFEDAIAHATNGVWEQPPPQLEGEHE